METKLVKRYELDKESTDSFIDAVSKYNDDCEFKPIGIYTPVLFEWDDSKKEFVKVKLSDSEKQELYKETVLVERTYPESGYWKDVKLDIAPIAYGRNINFRFLGKPYMNLDRNKNIVLWMNLTIGIMEKETGTDFFTNIIIDTLLDMMSEEEYQEFIAS